VYSSACSFGFLAESLKQSDDGLLFVAPVEDIPGLHDHEIPTDPAVVRVNGASQAQGSPSGLQVAMKIADGDKALRGLKPRCRLLSGRAGVGAGGKNQRGERDCKEGGVMGVIH
jgi:hypothetical protein